MKNLLRLCFVFLTPFFFSSNVFAACDDLLPVAGERDDVLVIVNDNSPDSCEVGKYYAEKRNLGRNNIVHVATRPRHLLNFPEFRNMMDQIIKYMQVNTLKPGAPPAPTCVDDGSFYTSPYYCQASVDHLRQYSKVRYLVTTKGVPSRSRIDNSTQGWNSSTSIDNYLSYWLMRYFIKDLTLNFKEREVAFKDGRGMRIVDPQNDGELIVGRLEGVTLETTKALIDRIMDAENNGIYGKNYGSKFGAYSSHARWFDYSTNKYVYGTSDRGATADSWRYQFGLFGESRPECFDYLNFSRTSPSGKAPQDCFVRFSDSPPGRSSSRTPIVDDALVYLGQLHGQSSGGGSFNTVLNWVRDANCSVKLCENAADPAACRALSTDVFKEINTQCVGVADGFMGYNYQSFPVAAMTLWPTGYIGSGSGGTNGEIAFPEVRSDIGQDDTHSLWFRNTDSIASPLCYSNSDFTAAADVACRDGYYMAMYPKVTIASQAVDTVTPQQYRVNFWYKGENITNTALVRVRIRVYEPTAKLWVNYGTQTVGTAALGTTDWANAEATFTLDPAKHSQADLVFNKIEVYVSSDIYVGELGVDNFSIKELVSNTELVSNPTFTDGHKQVSGGDHAAMFLNRLNGVAYWGSLSHHESGGHSFNAHPQETLTYFLRGLPLGDAVWWGENHNSGIFYGDPIYSPAAVRFDYLNTRDYVTGVIKLSGSTVNGRDMTLVSTTYDIDYCEGSDFFVCDQNSSWVSTGLSGVGGQENMALGDWDATSLITGPYTLRLKVTSNNSFKGRSQSLYDYYPVTIYDPAADDDSDGLNNGDEVSVYGTDPLLADTDKDGLSDGDEVNLHKTNPLSSDTDSDLIPDAWEINHNLNPLVDDAAADLDGDGLTNLEEFNLKTNPENADTDYDELSDGDEVHTYLTNPLLKDTDRDHVNDGLEITNGTNPLSNTDQDLDGMSDDWETIYGTVSDVDDALSDLDSDNVTNIIEYLRYTLPNDASSKPVITTLIVDVTNVSGVEDGTVENPFSTVGSAIIAAKHGDTVSLASGIHVINNFIYLTKSIKFVGPEDLSAELSGNYLYVASVKWGGFYSLKINTSYNYLFSTRHFEFKKNTFVPANEIWVAAGSNISFKNNLIKNLGVLATEAIWIDNDSHVDLINNTIVGFPVGIRSEAYYNQTLSGSPGTAMIRNSIFVNTDDFVAPANSMNVQYSLISDGEFSGVNGNISVAPLFVNAANDDYHLQTGSAAIDAGDPDSIYVNEPQQNGCRINMGAYGNTSAATVSTFDPDNDGLFSYCEVRAGTNAHHPDTDMDGVKDGADAEPTNQFSPFMDGYNLSVMPDFKDPDVIDGTYSIGDKVNIRLWSSSKGIDWHLLNPKQVFYKLKLDKKIILDGTLDKGNIICELTQNTCMAQMDLTIESGLYTLELQVKDRNGIAYEVSKLITVNP